MPRRNIGPGTNMSIAKAALIFFYERNEDEFDSLNYGNLFAMHAIVDIAGGQHIGPDTPAQVTARLAGSPYWDSELIRGMYKGMRGNGNAAFYTPSKKGKEFYEKHLKNVFPVSL